MSPQRIWIKLVYYDQKQSHLWFYLTHLSKSLGQINWIHIFHHKWIQLLGNRPHHRVYNWYLNKFIPVFSLQSVISHWLTLVTLIKFFSITLDFLYKLLKFWILSLQFETNLAKLIDFFFIFDLLLGQKIFELFDLTLLLFFGRWWFRGFCIQCSARLLLFEAS